MRVTPHTASHPGGRANMRCTLPTDGDAAKARKGPHASGRLAPGCASEYGTEVGGETSGEGRTMARESICGTRGARCYRQCNAHEHADGATPSGRGHREGRTIGVQHPEAPPARFYFVVWCRPGHETRHLETLRQKARDTSRWFGL